MQSIFRFRFRVIVFLISQLVNNVRCLIHFIRMSHYDYTILFFMCRFQKNLHNLLLCYQIQIFGRLIDCKYVNIGTLYFNKCRPLGGTFYFFSLVRNPSGNSSDHGRSRFRSSGFGKGPILRSSSNT